VIFRKVFIAVQGLFAVLQVKMIGFRIIHKVNYFRETAKTMKKDFKNISLSPSDITNSPIQLGDKVESVDLGDIELIRVSNYPFSTTNDNGRILKRSENGEEVEVLFEEKYKFILEGGGGWINLKEKEVWLVINSKGGIESIKIEDFHRKLGLKQIDRKKCTQLFGEPEEFERAIPSYDFFYFERGFEISIPYKSSDFPPSITFGKLSHEKTWLTARDLLECYLEFENNHGGVISTIAEGNFMALLLAFNIYKYPIREMNKRSLEYFLGGEFTFKEDIERYEKTVDKMKEYNQDVFNGAFDESEIEVFEIGFAFSSFLDYRKSLNQFFEHNSGVLESSTLPSAYAVSLTEKVNKKLFESIQEIDKILCEIIDPLNRKFSVAELEKDFGYLNTNFNYIRSFWDWDDYPKEMVKK
jgi:hypothetical protein